MSDSIKIKKYPNRRLYNTATSEYIKLTDLVAMVEEDVAFCVVDSKTGEDLTGDVLNQIILEQTTASNGFAFNLDFQRRLIRQFSGVESGSNFLPDYLEHALKLFETNQSEMQAQFTSNTQKMMAAGQTLAEQNFKMYQDSMKAFGFPTMPNPMSNPMPNGISGTAQTDTEKEQPQPADKSENPPKTQLEDLQRQLNELRALMGEKS